jgi:hypothetical protein
MELQEIYTTHILSLFGMCKHMTINHPKEEKTFVAEESPRW